MDRDWSAALFEERLVAAFREMQGRAIYSPRRNVLKLVAGHRITGLELIALTAQVLGRESFERIALLTWARAQVGGASVSEVCREKGWARRTFEDCRRRATGRMVVAITVMGGRSSAT